MMQVSRPIGISPEVDPSAGTLCLQNFDLRVGERYFNRDGASELGCAAKGRTFVPQPVG